MDQSLHGPVGGNGDGRAERFCNRSLARSKIKRDGLKAGTHAPDFRLPLLDGRGELSLRVIERFGCTVTAIDRSSPMLDAARARAQQCGVLDRLRLVEADVTEFKAESESFDLTGEEPWACCECDCTEKLERHLITIGRPLVDVLRRVVGER